MAKRTRVDGAKFEQEFRSAVEQAPFPTYLIRLRTPQLAYANVNNIVDFILFARNVTLIELKETGEKSFSLNTFQQKEEVEKYKPFFGDALNYYNWKDSFPYRLVVLVHFIKEGKYTLYYLDEHPFKVIHIGDDDCKEFNSLREVVRFLIEGY